MIFEYYCDKWLWSMQGSFSIAHMQIDLIWIKNSKRTAETVKDCMHCAFANNGDFNEWNIIHNKHVD